MQTDNGMATSGAAPTAALVAGRTLPTELAKGPALHCLVRVELTNGTIAVGRITDMDPATMNLKIDAISFLAVRRARAGQRGENGNDSSGAMGGHSDEDEVEVKPVALRCINSLVVRGGCVRYMDFISEESTGGRDLEDINAVAASVRPS